VCALASGIAAERSVYYFWDYFSFFLFFHSVLHIFLPEGLSWDFETLHGVLSDKVGTPQPLRSAFFSVFLIGRGAFMSTSQLQLKESN
jgi:hypothetical protein